MTLLAVLLLCAEARAAVYRYVDDRGVVHFTDVPKDHRYKSLPTYRGRVVEHRDLAPEDSFDRLILQSARNHRLEPALVKAVIAAESNFEPKAVSRAGAQGLMQLMPGTARDMGVGNPFHPGQNVEGGTRYLRDMLDRFGDLEIALAAYNAGPEAVDRYSGVPPFPETLDYVSRVLNYYRGYHVEFRRSPARSSRPPSAQKKNRRVP
jgi:soluble lytic murein transglycosylase